MHIAYIFEGSFEAKTSDDMDKWKAQPGTSSEREKVRRENIGDGEDHRRRKTEERRCRCAKKGRKISNTVFFRCFVAPEGRKCRLAKAAGAEPAAK